MEQLRRYANASDEIFEYLVLGFAEIPNCTFATGYNCAFDTGYNCVFKTGSNCTFDTGSNCNFATGSNCVFKTGYDCNFYTNSDCVVVFSHDKTLICQPQKGEIVQTPPNNTISGFLIDGAFEGRNYIVKDNVLSEVISKRGNIYKVKNYGDEDITFLIVDGDKSAHGKTLKDAREGLIYKIGNRDKSAYDGVKLEDNFTVPEFIEMYRIITGACEYGVKSFIESQDKVKKKYTVSEIIELTKGHYGSNEFKEFFLKTNKGK